MTTLIILFVAAYLTIGVIYFTLTCDDEKAVANPLQWFYHMIAWGILIWK